MDIKKHICNICNKEYKSPQSLWNHKKNIHENKKKYDQNMTNNMTIHDQNMTKNDHNPTINDQNMTIINNNETVGNIIDNTICVYCNKKYSAYTHMRRHLKTCKLKNNIETKYENIKKEHEEMKKSYEEMKKLMLDTMNRKYKMHPKTLQKMINNINTNTNTNTNSNNTINMTINNNIKYVELGDEELHKVFSKKEKMSILSGLGSPMDKIIKHTHLNDDYPQFQTIIITNVKSNLAYIYNKDLKKYILHDKAEILENLIEYRFDDLQCFYDEYKDKLSSDKIKNLEKFFLLKSNDKYYADKSKDYNVIIYNECNKDNIKYKSIDDNNDSDDNMLDC